VLDYFCLWPGVDCGCFAIEPKFLRPAHEGRPELGAALIQADGGVMGVVTSSDLDGV